MYSNLLVWSLPAIVGIFTYLDTYFSSQFSGREYFSLTAIFSEVAQLYIYGFLGLFILSRKPAFSKRYFCLSIVSIALGNVALNSLMKLYYIVAHNQNDALSWLHYTNYLVEGVIIGLAVSFLVTFVLGLRRQHLLQLQQTELERQASDARLMALQRQINPHFLFNNLNTLQALIEPDNTRAQSYLTNLADLLRSMLKSHEFPLFTLKQDIDNALLFMSLVEIRFENCIEVELDIIDADTLYIPPFTLQLLLENVVKHNQLTDGEPIVVLIKQMDKSISVSNEKRPVEDSPDSTHVGLDNLNQRLLLLSEKPLTVSDDDKIFAVNIPLVEVNDYD